MKKGLIRLLLSAITIFTFTSYNTGHIHIPLEKKLREIEQDKYEKDISDCKCKAFRYNMNLREANEDANIIIGWVNNSKDLHAYLRNKEGRILDPTSKNNQDGVFFEESFDYKDIYFFKKDITIEEYVLRKNCEKDKKMLKKYKEAHPDFKKRVLSEEEIIKNITRYCQKDSIICVNYIERVNKLPNKK